MEDMEIKLWDMYDKYLNLVIGGYHQGHVQRLDMGEIIADRKFVFRTLKTIKWNRAHSFLVPELTALIKGI